MKMSNVDICRTYVIPIIIIHNRYNTNNNDSSRYQDLTILVRIIYYKPKTMNSQSTC